MTTEAMTLHLYDNGEDLCVAESPADATELLVAEGRDPDDGPKGWEALPDGKAFTLSYYDQDDDEGNALQETHTAAEWCTQEGRGYLGGRSCP